MRVSLCPELVKEKGKVKQVDTMGALKKRREAGAEAGLPEPFAGWFASRGWRPHAHQLRLLDLAARAPRHAADRPHRRRQDACRLPAEPGRSQRARRQSQAGIHTLYVSPLKALAVDIARNLTEPVAEMGLPITLETRTGDTPPSRRQRQRLSPPDILLDHAGADRADAVAPRCCEPVRRRSAWSSSTSCMRWPRPSAAISSRSILRGCAR